MEMAEAKILNDLEVMQQVLSLLRQNQSPEYGYAEGLVRQMESMENEIRMLNARLSAFMDQLSQIQGDGIKDRTAEVYGAMSGKGQELLRSVRDLAGHTAQKGREWIAAIRQGGEVKLHSFLEGTGIREKLEELRNGLKDIISELEKDIRTLDNIESEFRQTGEHLANAFRLIGGREVSGRETEPSHVLSGIPRQMLEAYKGMLDWINGAIQSFDRLGRKADLEAVKKDGTALEHMENQTPEICMEAVKQNGMALEYVKEQTPELCMEAVRQDGLALWYVNGQTPEICMEAVKKDGMALDFVNGQTPEIRMAAVNQNGMALEFAEEQTPELCMAAVKQNGMSLEYVKEQTPELCMEAVRQDGRALEYVKEQTPELCTEAVKQDGRALKYVDAKFMHIFMENDKQPKQPAQKSSVIDKLNRYKNEIKNENEKREPVQQKQQEAGR